MPRSFFLFAPGAGAPSTHPWMQKWKHYLESIGEVVLFDYEYMREGRKRPDPPLQLIAAHRSALAEIRKKPSGPIFLIGKAWEGASAVMLRSKKKSRALFALVIHFAAAVIGQNCVIRFCASYKHQFSLSRECVTSYVR